MKKAIVFISILAFLFSSASVFAGDRVTVRGYWKKDGTYVQPHYRASPDSSRTNNYSYPGNYNPNTSTFTPNSSSPKETYPTNPSPYERNNVPGSSTYNPYSMPKPAGIYTPPSSPPNWQPLNSHHLTRSSGRVFCCLEQFTSGTFSL